MKPSTPKTIKWLVISSILYILFSLITTGIAISLNRPAAFGGQSSGLPVVQDFLYGKGTSMSPPLWWLVVQVVLTILAPRWNGWGTAGIIGLVVWGLGSGIGGIGEPINLEIFNPVNFNLFVALVQAGIIILPFVMMVSGIFELVRRRQRSSP